FDEILKSIVRVVTLGGNVILGVGPKPDGDLPEPALNIMKKLGSWLNVFGEAVYGTRGCPEYAGENLGLTKKNDNYYLFFAQKDGGKKIRLSDLGVLPRYVIDLETGNRLQTSDETVDLPTTSFPIAALKIKVK
ncbi:hypothetical protein EQ500_13455, partial [Lactobacillus sp. XV13L]|nr:hypothetical protein [Lactobacillus sp. XV13L]